MKRILYALFAASLALSGCGSSDVSTKPDKSEATGGSGADNATVWQPVTIKGLDKGSQLQVTLKKIADTKPNDQFSTVDPGKRLVAVQFSIVNTGTAAYKDAPSNGAKVVDKSGQKYDSDIHFPQITAGQVLPTPVKLAPKRRALGYITFQVPVKAEIAQVQFAMDSGYGGTARWNVK